MSTRRRAGAAGGSKTYRMGNVGAGAAVVQGDASAIIGNTLGGVSGGDELVPLFTALVKRIETSGDLDEETRTLAVEKTTAVAEGLAQAEQSPSKLKKALLDAKAFLSGTVKWAWDELSGIIESDAAQKTIGTITEAGTRAAIRAMTGAP